MIAIHLAYGASVPGEMQGAVRQVSYLTSYRFVRCVVNSTQLTGFHSISCSFQWKHIYCSNLPEFIYICTIILKTKNNDNEIGYFI